MKNCAEERFSINEVILHDWGILTLLEEIHVAIVKAGLKSD
jgi:hypothetical protein